jgi:hypothetical protein
VDGTELGEESRTSRKVTKGVDSERPSRQREREEKVSGLHPMDRWMDHQQKAPNKRDSMMNRKGASCTIENNNQIYYDRIEQVSWLIYNLRYKGK